MEGKSTFFFHQMHISDVSSNLYVFVSHLFKTEKQTLRFILG